MHINQRTKGWERCTAEAMLLGMKYAFVTHVYFNPRIERYVDPETMEPLAYDELDQRGRDFLSIFKFSKTPDGRTMLQYLKDYGPQP